VDQRLRELDALAHALGIFTNTTPGFVDQANTFEGDIDGTPKVRATHPEVPAEVGHEFAAGHRLVEGVLLRTKAEPTENRRGPERVDAEHLDAALRRRELTGQQLQEGRLARAVGAQQPGHARLQLQRHVDESDDTPVPLGDRIEIDDHVTTSTLRMRHPSISRPAPVHARMLCHAAASGIW